MNHPRDRFTDDAVRLLKWGTWTVAMLCGIGVTGSSSADEPTAPRAYLDGTGPGWHAWGEADFVHVNDQPDTWQWRDGVLHCTGQPVGVLRSKEPLKNFELSVEWRHLQSAGNSGVFVWTTEKSLATLQGPGLPHGIEVQVLDLGFKAAYEKQAGKRADWFTTHGDVFAVGESKMKPFPPLSPDGSRSFPTAERTHPSPQWNHYYVRAINGEVRLWVNGAEVSGGSDCRPAEGYLCLESEGAPVEFRNLRVRVLP